MQYPESGAVAHQIHVRAIRCSTTMVTDGLAGAGSPPADSTGRNRHYDLSLQIPLPTPTASYSFSDPAMKLKSSRWVWYGS